MVDVLATDVYKGGFARHDYDQLNALAAGKPIALGEMGALPPVEILRAQPRWAWFMHWGEPMALWMEREAVRGLFENEAVLTWENLPWVKNAKPGFIIQLSNNFQVSGLPQASSTRISRSRRADLLAIAILIYLRNPVFPRNPRSKASDRNRCTSHSISTPPLQVENPLVLEFIRLVALVSILAAALVAELALS